MIRSFPSKSREQRRFVAEAVADAIDRRKLLGSVCACGFATLLDLELTCFAAAETVAAPARAIHASSMRMRQRLRAKWSLGDGIFIKIQSLAIEKSVPLAWLHNTCASLAVRSERRLPSPELSRRLLAAEVRGR